MSFWSDLFDPLGSWASDLANKLVVDPVKQLSANIASGLETGLLSLVGDVWKVILPALQIIGGLIIIYLALSVGLKGEIPSIAGAAFMAAKI